MDKALRNALIAGIIIITLSIGYYLVIFLPKKEATRIEQQNQEKEANLLKESEIKDQQKKEYVSKRKKDCYDIYLKEKGQWNNVEGSDYREITDTCYVIYKSNERARTKEQCSKLTENLNENTAPILRDILIASYGDCLDNNFRKEF
jgi:isopenicillin N synthase-like dioxygenase